MICHPLDLLLVLRSQQQFDPTGLNMLSGREAWSGFSYKFHVHNINEAHGCLAAKREERKKKRGDMMLALLPRVKSWGWVERDGGISLNMLSGREAWSGFS